MVWKIIDKVGKESVINEFSDKEGEVMIGMVAMEDQKNYYIDLGRTRGMLPKSEIIPDEKARSTITHALQTPGIVLVCGSPLSGKTHIIYSLLMETAAKGRNLMTIESIAKYELKGVNQCELNENIGFNMDKALRFVEFQSPDTIYLEGIKTRDAFEFLSELFYNDKTVLTEFMANNMTDLRQKLAFDDFQSFKTLISCLIFIHSKDSIEVFDKTTLQKYLA